MYSIKVLIVIVFYVFLFKNGTHAKGSIWDLILPKQFKYETKKEPGEFGVYYNYDFPKSNIDPRTHNYFYRRDADKEKIAEAFEKNAHYITDQQFTILKNLNVLPEKDADVIHSAVNEIRFPSNEKVQSVKDTEKVISEEDDEKTEDGKEEEGNNSNDEQGTNTENDTKEEDTNEENENDEIIEKNTQEEDRSTNETVSKKENNSEDAEITTTENDTKDATEKQTKDNENNKIYEGKSKNETATQKTVVKHINNIKITAELLYLSEENSRKVNVEDNNEEPNKNDHNKVDRNENNKEDINEIHAEETKDEENEEEEEAEEEENSSNQTTTQRSTEKRIKIIKIVTNPHPLKNK